MRTILITGGAGFIGTHISLVLLEKGYKVFVIDSFENSSEKSLDRVLDLSKNKERISESNTNLFIFKGDIRDKKFLNSVFSEILIINDKIDGIIHLAGVKSVFESLNNPIHYWNINVLGTLNLLEVMNKYKCKNFVFSSSATIYKQKK